MKLRTTKDTIRNLVEMLSARQEPDPSLAREVLPLFEELGDVLGAESRGADAAKARKAALLCEGIATGGSVEPGLDWRWVVTTAAALRAVVCDGVVHEEAGYTAAAAPQETVNELSMLADAELIEEFCSRQSEQLIELESLALRLESGEDVADASSLMRFFHTLKGEAALLGFADISKLAHAAEQMLTTNPLSECSERLIAIKDWLAQALVQPGREAVDIIPAADLILQLASGSQPTAASDVSYADVGIDEKLFEMDVRAGDLDLLEEFVAEAGEHLTEAEAALLTLEKNAGDADALNTVFRDFHTIKGVAGFVEMAHIQGLAHRAENILGLARKGEIEIAGVASDRIFEAMDMLRNLLADITGAMAADGRLPRREELPGLLDRLRRCCEEDGGVEKQASDTGAEDQGAKTAQGSRPVVANVEPGAQKSEPAAKTSGFFLLNDRKSTAGKKVAVGAAGSSTPAEPVIPPAHAQHRESVRVDAARLDLLVEMIGELVIVEAMVSKSPVLGGKTSAELARNVDQLDKISRELQEIGMSLRMVHVRPVFQKMARLVRDLSRKTGRKIEFTMSGEDTELDKSVVEKISDPLVHMIRNAVDHGIESDPRDRLAQGKPAVGMIHLSAFHKGGNIIIEVEDDGKGLDREAILAKAVERGLVKAGQSLSEREINNLIFEAGFSTAAEVTEVSGRGVGMDVVRRNIEALRGSVEIESFPGQGCTFRFKLPLTLAIIDGIVAEVGPEHYVIPTLSVVRLIQPHQSDISTVRGEGEMLRFEDEFIPLFRLHRLFAIAGAKTGITDSVVVVVESEGRRVGLVTDGLVGQQQVVIKGLGEMVQGTPGLAGGAIMSDGNVALILDIAGLVLIAQDVDRRPGALEVGES